MDAEERRPTREQALLEQLKRGHTGAWDEIVRGQLPKLLGFCMRMLRSRQEAEDVCQEVWERAIRSIETFRGESSLETWLCTIARNRCLTRLDSAKRSKASRDEDAILEIPDAGPGPDDRLHGEQLRVAMEKAIGTLDPDFREAILLCDFNGLSYAEIAAATNVPIATVKTRIHRARVRLQALLAEFRS